MISRDSTEGRALAWLRYPLAALIVFIHTHYTADGMTHYVATLLSATVAEVAVPTFFFISGYLFFANRAEFGLRDYGVAMRRKASTLLLPYLLWSVLAYYGCGLLRWMAGGSVDLSASLYEVFYCARRSYVEPSAFGYSFPLLTTPAGLPALWFLRDLMVAMALSPLVWVVARRLRLWTIALCLGALLLNVGVPVDGFGLFALTFFSIGATMSICGYSIARLSARYGRWLIAALGVLIIADYCFEIGVIAGGCHILVVRLLKIVGVVAMPAIALRAVAHHPSARPIIHLGEASFFVYVAHTMPLFGPLMASTAAWPPLAAYLFGWGFRLAATTILYFALRRFAPRLLAPFVGFRL